jgi:hypothetical protein
MNDKTYNGWTNYATWRVNLEVFDGWDYTENGFHGLSTEDKSDVYDLAEYLKDFAEEIIFEGCSYDERRPDNLVADYARAFLSDVNWHEIATHMIEDNEE